MTPQRPSEQAIKLKKTVSKALGLPQQITLSTYTWDQLEALREQCEEWEHTEGDRQMAAGWPKGYSVDWSVQVGPRACQRTVKGLMSFKDDIENELCGRYQAAHPA